MSENLRGILLTDIVYTYVQSGFTPLHIASHYGNIGIGRFLIDKGADVNYKARVCAAASAADW